MRYASRLDYFLFNTLFVREGLRLSAFANGLSFYYYAPLLRGIGNWARRRRLLGAARREADHQRALAKAEELAAVQVVTLHDAEEKARLQSLGSLEALLETLRQRLAEQKGRHQADDFHRGR